MSKEIKLVMYHYVRDLKNSAYPHIKGLDQSVFEQQMAYMKEHYTFLSMEDLVEAAVTKNDRFLPENGVVLTFDDGYVDHYEVVYKILKKYGAKGAFFPNAMAVKEHKLLTVNRIHFILAAAEAGEKVTIQELVEECRRQIETYRREGIDLPEPEKLYRELAVPNRWDPGEVIFVKRLLQNALPEQIRTDIAKELFARYIGEEEEMFAKKLYMNRQQMEEMKDHGMYFGIHGYDHYWLGKLDEADMKQDIEKARTCFKGLVPEKNWVMNYPYGNYSDAVIRYIRENQCALALGVEAGSFMMGRDNVYTIPRYDANDVYPKGTLV